ncbi:Uncharacterized membrane protein [Pseudoxanthomonas sp. GM95]|uniref:DUF1003 domain-containing protein n=1 Tax=Pseudoxanthomonas sp. GM95 TaxID=1881043 RepID=UPI0008BFC622|nr:DUF1003 domain-containing protein [Pseudoxanthomonas sp. GM95]SEK64115.1 Uncharacterized membrane protein [Pseudoxanthomonas sp. GM95]
MPLSRHRYKAPDRLQTARALLQSEIEKLPEDERAIVERFVQRKQVSRNIVRDYDQSSSLGERIADRVAAIGGSWSFILVFLGCLIGWMVLNSLVLARDAFDPYPYILLNLCLSCVAAIQAPIIMMSQNRQGTIDRLRAENDYAVNVKAELEIMQLQEKLNGLRDQDWTHLVELQQQQILMLQRLVTDLCGAAPAVPASFDIPEQKSE